MNKRHFVIAGYDISGIQEFIFKSNELKDNVSASNIVKNILSIDLPNLIEIYAHKNNLKIDIKWDSKRFKMLDDNELDIEIIYIGGGNAYVAYRDRDLGIDVTKHFSKMVFENTYSLSVAVGYVDCTSECSLFDKFDELNKELNNNKARMIRSLPMQNIAITKNDVNTGFPITEIINDEFITKEKEIKSEKYKKDQFDEFILNTGFKYAFDFDQLVEKKGEDSFIAVVHIDGNNMGKKVRDIMRGNDIKLSLTEQMHDYVDRIRILSREIEKKYNLAFKKMLKDLANYEKNASGVLPIRPIILNGDDITFVCKGKYALSLTEIFLKEINLSTINCKDEYKQSACAGIYFVHSHFPFHIAYELAEQVCSNAKKKAKEFARANKEEEVGSWIDFDISYTGLTVNVDEARKKKYNLPELGSVELFKNGNRKYEGYNLLNRPYYVTENTKKKVYEFRSLIKLINHFKNKWPRNKIKELRNAYMKSIVLVQRLIAENKSRGRLLYDENDIILGEALNTGFIQKDNFSPFFDALEIIDLYENIGGECK